MEPDRFDDVEVRHVEDLEARAPRRRRRRWPVALGAAAVAAGILAAGASALTGSHEPAAARKAASPHRIATHPHGAQCHAGEAQRRRAALDASAY